MAPPVFLLREATAARYRLAMRNDSADAQGLPRGWIPIGARRWSNIWIDGAVVGSVLFLANGLNFSIIFGKILGVSPIPLAAALPVILVAILALARFVHNRRWPQPAVNLDTSQLRAGTNVVPLAAIDSAWLGAIPTRNTRVLVLRITAGKAARAEFILRDRQNHTPDSTTCLVLAEALRRTAIVMPVSKDDPSGRFAHYNFPGHITREQAVALALDPPTRSEPIPIPS